MADETRTALISFFAGAAFGSGAVSKTFNGGLVSLGKGVSAFVNATGSLFEVVKDKFGNIKIGNPLKNDFGENLKIAFKKTGTGIGKVAGTVVSFSGGVWKTVKDGYGDTVNARPIARGEEGKNGVFCQERTVSDSDIDEVNKIFDQSLSRLDDKAKQFYSTAKNIEDDVDLSRGDSMMMAPSVGTSPALPVTPPVTDNKMMLYVGGGILVIIILILAMQRGNK
ncbi:MAG: hypothetical protein QME49_01645 [bacterium]|nr:hypothetical protein [bacterium]